MVSLLSIGFTLLVLALMLIVLWRVERRGKMVDLQSTGISLVVLGVAVWVVVGAIVWWIQELSSQEWSVFANTAMAIVLTGGILAIQGIAQKKPATLPIVRYGAFATALIGLAFIIWFLIAR